MLPGRSLKTEVMYHLVVAIHSSPADKHIYSLYQVDINFWDLGMSNITETVVCLSIYEPMLSVQDEFEMFFIRKTLETLKYKTYRWLS